MGRHAIAVVMGTLALAVGSLLAARPASATAPVGVTVYAEEWTPSKINSESLKVIENNPTLLSDTLNTAWLAFRQWYLGTIPQILQQQNYLHSVDSGIPSGISLYDRKGNTHLPPEMTLPTQPEFTIKSDGPNMLRVNFIVPATSISLCATTPTPVGNYGDPCATLLVDVALGMGIQISDTPGRLFTVTTANITTGNFRAQDPNLPTEIIQGLAAVYAYLGGPNYQATVVKAIDTNKLSITSQLQAPVSKLNGTIGSYEQSALMQINQLLQPAASIDRLLHIAAVVQPANNGQTLAILLAPPTTGVNFNSAAMTGQFKGTLTFDGSVKDPPASCSQLDSYPQIKGQVQSGPRPVVSFNGVSPVYGTAPLQTLNVAFDGDRNPLSAARSCPYTLEHLVVGFPNILNFSSFTFKATGQAQISTNLEIQPSHWASPVIVGANGVVISTGTATASTQPNFARQVQNGNIPSAGAPTTSGLVARGAPASTTRSWTATNPVTMQSGARMDLVASLGVSFQAGAGALPQRAHIGVTNTGDPLANRVANQATAPATNQVVGQAAQVSSSQVQGTTPTKAPNWGGTASWTPASPSTSNTMRTTTPVGTLRPIQSTQQPATIRAAPSSLGGP